MSFSLRYSTALFFLFYAVHAHGQVTHNSDATASYTRLDLLRLMSTMEGISNGIVNGAALNAQDTLTLQTTLFANDGIIEGSLGVGEACIIPDGTTNNDFFSFSTVLIESSIPTMALVDSSEIDEEWITWMLRANGPGDGDADSFSLERSETESSPLIIAGGGKHLALRVGTGVHLANGLDLGNGTLTTGLPDTTNLPSGSLTYWLEDHWEAVEVGAHQDELHWCDGKPTWGPCPSPQAFEWASLSYTNPDFSLYEISGHELAIGNAQVTSKVLMYTKDATFHPDSIASIDLIVGNSNFSESIGPLDAGETYFIWAVARTKSGSVSSDTLTVAAPDYPTPCGNAIAYNGQTYSTVEIGNSCWFTDNLMTTSFADGHSIAQQSSFFTTSASAAYAYPSFNSSYTTPGFVYNVHAVSEAPDHLGICPLGWDIARLEDWQEVENAGPIGAGTPLNIINVHTSITGYAWDGLSSSCDPCMSYFQYNVSASSVVVGPGLEASTLTAVSSNSLQHHLSGVIPVTNNSAYSYSTSLFPIRCVRALN
jgi:uncharacterized protein (TIGR02145 family)